VVNSDVRIGLALGSGAAKGSSILGVMKVFEKYNIKISFIAGSSVGAILGAGFALGYSCEEVIQRAKQFASTKFSGVKNFNLFSDSLIKDKEINAAIKKIVGDATFEDCKIPFKAVAVDLESGKEVVLDKGSLWRACRASGSIPFVFSPTFYNERYLVDGGLLNPVPVDVARKENIDILIAVELGAMTSRQYISAMVWEKYYRKPKTFELYPSFLTKWRLNTSLMAHVLLRSLDIAIDVYQQQRYQKAKPDIIIAPRVEHISMLDFHLYESAISSGIQAAKEAMPAILALIEQKRAEKERDKAINLTPRKEASPEAFIETE
jgi:NTE family protein